MGKNWLKTAVTVTMSGEGHEEGLKRSFGNMPETVTDDQIKGLGSVLEAVSKDKFDFATVTATEKIVNN
ncbi:hypothetical protein SIN07_00410 [Pediococcus inopinatus]|uniref:DUF1659 domain-containing protein n=1 Tax=Pediococcus inopinatus TaxID=114090 RepID=UPI002A69A302|nr:hypothetical protein [Pediococcus inopinatus]WPP09368.1 hypothetical protein SIN07_00410 [Pediococcus inopinatus]